ncbi:Galanin receptor type 2 [Schistosoma haematobium]|uniref:Galanin receptor type 2 n=1 Tax=Schistosoma haematobium TaxID=6185 RepID=A0A922LP81_SCHHA|nr:Galanin receptor type 2 [Schistosoma haematobium]KAH9590806.1 Galanin receptor type 2 [Schistosoma haematobium]
MKMYSCWLIWLFIGFVVGVNHAIQDQMNVSTVVTEPYIHSSGTNSKASSSSCLKGFKANELNVFLVFARIVTPVVFGLILIIGFVERLDLTNIITILTLNIPTRTCDFSPVI